MKFWDTIDSDTRLMTLVVNVYTFRWISTDQRFQQEVSAEIVAGKPCSWCICCLSFEIRSRPETMHGTVAKNPPQSAVRVGHRSEHSRDIQSVWTFHRTCLRGAQHLFENKAVFSSRWVIYIVWYSMICAVTTFQYEGGPDSEAPEVVWNTSSYI